MSICSPRADTARSTLASPTTSPAACGGTRPKAVPGFSARYGVSRLVWYETYERIDEAITREKAIKKWRRGWKVRLIEAENPEWVDLYEALNR